MKQYLEYWWGGGGGEGGRGGGAVITKEPSRDPAQFSGPLILNTFKLHTANNINCCYPQTG